MKTKWLIEDSLFEQETPNLTAALDKAEIEYKVVQVDYNNISSYYKHRDIRDELQLEPWDDDDDETCPVVYYGPLELGYRIQRHTKFVPGVYTTMENYACTKYYPEFTYHLLNCDYVLIPYGDLERRLNDIRWMLRSYDLFIRPNKGNKLFTGFSAIQNNQNGPKKEEKICDTDTTIQLYYNNAKFVSDYLAPYDLNSDELILLAPNKNVKSEWRFVIAGDRVVGQVCYNRGLYKVLVQPKQEDDEARHFVEHNVLAHRTYRPDKVFTMDICSVCGTYKLLEINGFSSAGLYDMDWTDAVVPISQAAEEEWNGYYV